MFVQAPTRDGSGSDKTREELLEERLHQASVSEGGLEAAYRKLLQQLDAAREVTHASLFSS